MAARLLSAGGVFALERVSVGPQAGIRLGGSCITCGKLIDCVVHALVADVGHSASPFLAHILRMTKNSQTRRSRESAE